MPAATQRDHLDSSETTILVIAAFALLWLLGPVLSGRLGMTGFALAELLLVLLPTWLWSRLRGVRPTRAWQLERRLQPRELVGSILIGLGGCYLTAALVEALQEHFFPLPPEVRAALERVLVPPDGLRPFALDWLVFALLPAVCEEALFRGALLGALLPAGRTAAVLGTAVLFGFYHGSFWKLASTSTIGLVLGATAIASGSLWPAIVAHATNNTLVLVLVRRNLDEPPQLGRPVAWLLLGAAAASLVLGFLLVRRRGER